jgi:CHASE2 domain-containing sensor protein
MSWQTLPDLDLLRAQICQKLAEPKGWDVLFFAGHSQESTSVGGELAIAPRVSLSIRDMTPALQKAQAQGLRLAIFNSCNGLGIALELISLGLSQVVAMREPIDNGAAQVFLEKFIVELRAYKSIDDALLETRNYLGQEGKLLHPSASLIPSLYCHPDAKLFQFQPWGVWQRLRRWQPSHSKLKMLGVCLGLSLLPSLYPTFLLDGRLLTQRFWRGNVSDPAESSPKQILVQIDDDSLMAAQVNSRRPLDRSYIARLVNDLVRRKSQVIGLDYVFDYQTANDLALKTAFKTAVEKQKTWLVFAAALRDGREIGINGTAELANLNWSVQGDVEGVFPYYMSVLQPGGDCKEVCPFSTVLATIHQFDRSANLSASLKPSLQSRSDLREQVVRAIEKSDRDSILKKIIQSPFQINFLETIKPLNDFSNRSDRVYTKISAGCLIDPKEVLNECPELPDFQGKIVIIAAGDYPGSGEKGLGDSDPAPLAFSYPNNKEQISRGEVHSYMVSQLLNQHFVIQIPDILGVLLAAPLAQILLRLLRSRRIKGWKDSAFLVVKLKKSRSKQQRSLIVALLIGDVIYLGIVLQIYVSAAVLVPWLLPVLTLNSLILIDRRKQQIDR